MTEHYKSPAEWVAEGDPYDITDLVGPTPSPLGLGRSVRWPMYSYDRPAYMLWNAIGAELNKRGWPDANIKAYLQSKLTRVALDTQLGDSIRLLGKKFAETIKDDDVPASWVEG